MVDFAKFFQALGSSKNLRGPNIVDDHIASNNITENVSDSDFGTHGNLRGTNFIESNKASSIYSILSKWYLLVTIPAMTVTYNVVKALEEQGVLAMLYRDVDNALRMLVDVSIKCPALITKPEEFMRCLGW